MSKQIVVGVCAGISAYKAAELVRLLCKTGYTVSVVMTESATQFITPLTFEALTGRRVYTQLIDPSHASAMDHIKLARWADTILIAPATADFIAKLRSGLADDLLSTLCLASTAPIMIAPAMNQQMWLNAATQENINNLKQRGMRLIGPECGSQACGETGPGRMTEPQLIVDQLCAVNSVAGLLDGMDVLVTAGPTREPIDPVRYISNRSSGKMGYALAQAARDAGAKVTLVSGPVAITSPQATKVIQVQTAKQMHDVVMQHISSQNIFIGCAAVSDYAPKQISSSKLKKHAGSLTIVLEKTQDIIRSVTAFNPEIFTVGFAAETDDLEDYARAKLESKSMDMIVANRVGLPDRGFEGDDNAALVLWDDGRQVFSLRSKKQLAIDITTIIAQQYATKNSN